MENSCIMAPEQCDKNSISASSSAVKWWPASSTICSWNTVSDLNYGSYSQKPNSNGSDVEEDVSISTSFTTNANSNNSGTFSMESSIQAVEKASANDHYGEAVSDNHHLWNQMMLDVGSTGELQNISTRMLEPAACDYLKKIGSEWELSGSANVNRFRDGLYDHQGRSRITSTENSWSIEPPQDEISPQLDQYIGQFTTIKNEHLADSNVQREELFGRRIISSDYEAELMQETVVGDGSNYKFYHENGMSDSDMVCNNGRAGFIDLVGFGSDLNKTSSESDMSNKTMNLPEVRKAQLLNSYQPIRPRSSTLSRISGKGNGVVKEGKRKKSEDQSGSLLKKTKLDTSTVTTTKIHIPKAKLGDKITTLQQIVSPFGKTDTASVLWETIGYIKCLQEQVQLLSNPYLKTNIIKDSWMRFETKDRGDMKLDLKSRGLCLVPVSCTPQVYHENTGSDFWTPTYRGCFYR